MIKVDKEKKQYENTKGKRKNFKRILYGENW